MDLNFIRSKHALAVFMILAGLTDCTRSALSESCARKLMIKSAQWRKNNQVSQYRQTVIAYALI